MADEIASRASPGEAVPHGESRASHEDRDWVVELLRVSAGDGRLTAEELDERVEAALTARTYNELAALVADLPGAPRRGGERARRQATGGRAYRLPAKQHQPPGPLDRTAAHGGADQQRQRDAGLHRRGDRLAHAPDRRRDIPREHEPGDQAGHRGEHRRPGYPRQQRQG